MPLTSGINSSSFSLGMEVLRTRVAANGRGEIRLGNETVSIVFDQADGRFLASGDSGGLLSELLLLGFNSGPQALSERLISMITQSQESLQEKISQCKFSVCPDSLQCPPEAAQCPITLEQPEEGVLVKNSEDSAVCCLFDANAFERLVREDLPHPLTREEITESMIVKPEECTYDHVRKNFVIKDN
ncbi:T3SS effector NleG family protein [Escherichia coli]|nr:T3SS effector NleG family protein [Escherichia coli]EHX9649993.1 T3SS effector NleG family protein [Escherichia coli]